MNSVFASEVLSAKEDPKRLTGARPGSTLELAARFLLYVSTSRSSAFAAEWSWLTERADASSAASSTLATTCACASW